jgi:hypothetical protein
MIDFQIVLDCIKKRKTALNKDKFTCERILFIFDSVYLITGDFIPFLFFKNKIYEINCEALFHYYHNKSHSKMIYFLNKEINDETSDEE